MRKDSSEKKENAESSEESSKGSSQFKAGSDGESDEQSHHHHYGCENTRWTIGPSDVTDPIYVRDSEIDSDYTPLPRVKSESQTKVDTSIEHHFIGILSSEEAETKVKSDDFALYYKKDRQSDVSTKIPLFVVHRNTKDEVFHFPVIRTEEDSGAKWWHVQIGSNKMQLFRQLSELVRCYHLYRFTDAKTGRMEVFPVWEGGIVDDYQ
ncbi:hypothetical protein Q1695_008399 [Nippostrongylus brasiliensis]|nr:hypothetical protein Q1695_008399 [Nippostrongylus brasiliensis]